MSQVGNVIVSLLVFILGICFVICLHELGHLSMAKLFKVYCTEYSIGFGPKICSINPKNKRTGKPLWETSFNIRCIPLGGYVSMISEDDPELLMEAGINDVPKERTFSGVNHGKQAIIMIAGIVMNILLSWFLCFVADAFCPQQDIYTNRVTIVENSNLANANLTTGTRIVSIEKDYPDDVLIIDSYKKEYDIDSFTNINDIKAIDDSLDRKMEGANSYFDISNTLSSQVYSITDDGKYYQPSVKGGTYESYIYLVPKSLESSPLTVTIGYADVYSTKNGDGTYDDIKYVTLSLDPISDDDSGFAYDYLGVSPYMSYSPKPYGRTSFVNDEGSPTISGESFSRAMGQAFYDQWNGIVSTYTAIGQLFVGKGIENVGGIVSIFRTTEQAVSVGPFYVFYLWGLISINIAVMNLIPFPGLDGWQLLVCIIESITRKKISKNFKGWASIIGIGVMLVLGIALIVYDIIRWVA